MKKAYSYIRFSSKAQASGDSLRRQLVASEAWAKKNNYHIVDSLQDLGISAYKGNHAKDGALSLFLQKVQEGLIPQGSVLIVESLDRLSRQEILTAFSQFTAILSAGIKIVTLIDGYEYSKDSINDIGNIMFSIMSMSRAHEESEVKSKRLKAAWENKRANAHKKIVTKTAPGWMKVIDGQFVLIPERVEIIKWIFKQSIAGLGGVAIAKKLNERGTPVFGRGKGWHQTFIAKLMQYKTVLGEFQPTTRSGGKHLNAGEPIKDYYPRIISDEIYYQAVAARKSRTHKGGRKGEKHANILQHIAVCDDCDSPMRYIRKGYRKYDGRYLTCSNALANFGCTHHRHYQYKSLEELIIFTSPNFDFTKYFSGPTTDYEQKIIAIEEEIKIESKRLEKLTLLLTEDDDLNIPEITTTIKKISSKKDNLLSDLEKLKELNYVEEVEPKEFIKRISSVLQNLFQTDDLEQLYNYRIELSDKLKKVIHQIRFSEDDNSTIRILPVIIDDSLDEEQLSEYRYDEAYTIGFEHFKFSYYDDHKETV